MVLQAINSLSASQLRATEVWDLTHSNQVMLQHSLLLRHKWSLKEKDQREIYLFIARKYASTCVLQ